MIISHHMFDEHNDKCDEKLKNYKLSNNKIDYAYELGPS